MVKNKANNEPFFLVYFGRQHSGKTYDLQKFVNECGKSTIFVYNSGRDEDWVGYEEIDLFSVVETKTKTKKLYFTYEGKEYEYEKWFMKKFRGKRVKAMEADEALTEMLLFRQLKRKGAHPDLFFIIDDCTSIFESRLTKPQRSCLYRAKHAGVWFALIYHDVNMFPPGAWGAVTIAKFFKNNVEPPQNKSKKIPHFEQFVRAYNKLKEAPNYSHCSLTMNDGKLLFHQPKK